MKANKLPKTTFAERGSRLVLPIIRHTLREVRLRSYRLPVLVFQDEHQKESYIELEAVNIQIVRGAVQHGLQWNSGIPYTANALMPFVEMLNNTVTDAVADKNGPLHLDFSNRMTLTATPDIYEGWHFRGSGLSLHGADGHLI